MSALPTGWTRGPLLGLVAHKSGDGKIIKGKQSAEPGPGLVQAFSASGPDVWVKDVQYSQDGVVVSAVGARCGKTFLATGSWTAIANTHALVPGPDVDVRFLWYLTNREEWWIRSGTAQPFVKVKATLERDQLLPPLDEQERIVEVLEEHLSRLDAALANVQTVRSKATHFRRSLLHASFIARSTEGTWTTTTLGELCELYQPKTISRKEMADDGAFPVYGANGIIGRHSEWNHEDAEVLLSCRGNVGTVNVSEPHSWINGNAMVCRPLPGTVSKPYLARMLEAVDMSTAISGTAQQQITRRSLSPLVVSYPETGHQAAALNEVDACLSRLDAALAAAGQVEAQCAALRRSLLHAAFTGKLTEEWRETTNV